jgi:hypothetical protein
MAAETAISPLIGFWNIYGSIIVGGAVIVSAVGAIWVVTSSRAVARKRAALDLILHIESDGDLIIARNRFIDIIRSDTKSEVYGRDEKRGSEEAKAIRTVLNINELVAVSIRENVIDERVWRKWFNRAFINDYEEMTGYIGEVRTSRGNPAIFEALEETALRWKADETWYAKPSWLVRKWRALRSVIQA